jgi:hypothetical protein
MYQERLPMPHGTVHVRLTREWLLARPNVEQALKLTQAYQKTGYYPTTYAVHVDQQSRNTSSHSRA